MTIFNDITAGYEDEESGKIFLHPSYNKAFLEQLESIAYYALIAHRAQHDGKIYPYGNEFGSACKLCVEYFKAASDSFVEEKILLSSDDINNFLYYEGLLRASPRTDPHVDENEYLNELVNRLKQYFIDPVVAHHDTMNPNSTIVLPDISLTPKRPSIWQALKTSYGRQFPTDAALVLGVPTLMLLMLGALALSGVAGGVLGWLLIGAALIGGVSAAIGGTRMGGHIGNLFDLRHNLKEYPDIIDNRISISRDVKLSQDLSAKDLPEKSTLDSKKTLYANPQNTTTTVWTPTGDSPIYASENDKDKNKPGSSQSLGNSP
ncbi:MAG: hypothetical protein GW760_05215 [Legionella sp.]|nr:hypothetical protein [Legionella sp.]